MLIIMVGQPLLLLPHTLEGHQPAILLVASAYSIHHRPASRYFSAATAWQKPNSGIASSSTLQRDSHHGVKHGWMDPRKAISGCSHCHLSTTTLCLAGTDDSENTRGTGGRSVSAEGTSDDAGTEWRAVLAAFRLYKAAYGDVKVPQKFVVPNLPPWPTAAHGLKLGRITQMLRATGSKYLVGVPEAVRRQRREQLEQLGFVWNVRRSSEEGEWAAGTDEQVLLAVQAYKQIVSENLADIPDNFVVPDTEEWPEIVRGLPLGWQLEVIQKNESDETNDVRAQLAALGVPMPNTGSVEDSDGDEEATTNLLGITTNADAVTSRPLTPELMKRLRDASGNAPGQNPSANDLRFQVVFVALVTYKQLYGDLLVPQPFVVPKETSDWPKETWGLRLGARVNAIRSQGTFVNNYPQRRDLLNEIGFEWNPPLERRRGRRSKTEPEENPQPSEPKEEAVKESTLASTDISFDDEDDYEELDGDSEFDDADDTSLESFFDGSFDFGKDYDMPTGPGSSLATTPSWNLEGARLPAQAAAAAKQEAAQAEAEENYVPPPSFEESFALATERAIECGVIEGLTEKGRVVKGKREKNIPWFNDDFGDDFVFEDVVEALTLYKSMHGDFSNLTRSGGSDFIVPAPKKRTGFLDDDDDDDDNGFLEDSFDVDASARAAAAIASYNNPRQNDRTNDFIAAEIKRLQDNADEPLGMEVDSGRVTKSAAAVGQVSGKLPANRWPEHLAGMSLGYIVTRICEGSLEVKHLPERKAQLDSIGFDWGDPKYFIDIPFEKAMCAMYAYYLVRGDMFVYEDFVMPDEDPWPQALAGYELGKAVKRIRELQNFFEAYHPDKVSLLRTIDFVWFADTEALPLDPNEKEMTPETLLLSAMGHPDYAKMIEIPMGLPDKLIADGPFFDTNDDPKLWWRKWHNWDYVKDYWYQQGRRDNAFVLRRMGYPRMADEHEAKYGPGLFVQIDEVLQNLENTSVEDMSLDERRNILEKLNFFRQEMIGCTDLHPLDRDALIADLDTKMLLIVKDTKLDFTHEDELNSVESGFEDANGKRQRTRRTKVKEESEDEVDEEDIDDEDDFDIEDELGLDALSR